MDKRIVAGQVILRSLPAVCYRRVPDEIMIGAYMLKMWDQGGQGMIDHLTVPQQEGPVNSGLAAALSEATSEQPILALVTAYCYQAAFGYATQVTYLPRPEMELLLTTLHLWHEFMRHEAITNRQLVPWTAKERDLWEGPHGKIWIGGTYNAG